MTAKISSARLRDAHNRIAQLDALGATLAATLDAKGTRVIFSARISGGFTLNVFNTIVMDPHLQDPASFDFLVCTLAHEYSHVQQGHLVDSVQQELIAYQVEAKIADTLQFAAGKQAFGKFLALDPTSARDLDTALAFILDLAGGSPATRTIYASLPKFQPRGAADNFAAALKQIAAVGIAGWQTLRPPP